MKLLMLKRRSCRPLAQPVRWVEARLMLLLLVAVPNFHKLFFHLSHVAVLGRHFWKLLLLRQLIFLHNPRWLGQLSGLALKLFKCVLIDLLLQSILLGSSLICLIMMNRILRSGATLRGVSHAMLGAPNWSLLFLQSFVDSHRRGSFLDAVCSHVTTLALHHQPRLVCFLDRSLIVLMGDAIHCERCAEGGCNCSWRGYSICMTDISLVTLVIFPQRRLAIFGSHLWLENILCYPTRGITIYSCWVTQDKFGASGNLRSEIRRKWVIIKKHGCPCVLIRFASE